MVKTYFWAAAALILTGCAERCLPDRSNTPCNVGFYHAQDWDEMKYGDERGEGIRMSSVP